MAAATTESTPKTTSSSSRKSLLVASTPYACFRQRMSLICSANDEWNPLYWYPPDVADFFHNHQPFTQSSQQETHNRRKRTRSMIADEVEDFHQRQRLRLDEPFAPARPTAAMRRAKKVADPGAMYSTSHALSPELAMLYKATGAAGLMGKWMKQAGGYANRHPQMISAAAAVPQQIESSGAMRSLPSVQSPSSRPPPDEPPLLIQRDVVRTTQEDEEEESLLLEDIETSSSYSFDTVNWPVSACSMAM